MAIAGEESYQVILQAISNFIISILLLQSIFWLVYILPNMYLYVQVEIWDLHNAERLMCLPQTFGDISTEHPIKQRGMQ